MRRIHWITLNLFTASAILFAQDRPASSQPASAPQPSAPQSGAQQNGGWRRAGDPAAPVAPAPSNPDQDPTQPVARTDAYGQPVQQQTDNQQFPQQSQQQQQQPEQQPQQQPMDRQTAPAMQRNDRFQNDRPQAAVPHYGLPASVTIKPGTFVTARVNQVLSSDHNQTGDVFTATLTQPLVVDGVVVAQRGQTVMGRVADAQKAGRAKGVSHLALQITAITLADGTQAPIQSHVVTRNGDTSVGRDVAAVGTTTAVGAGVGAVAAGGMGAGIGAGAGAAAGLVGVLLTRGHPTVVYPETVLTFQSETPVTVDLSRAPQAYRFVGPEDYNRNTPTTTVVRRAPTVVYGAPGYYGYDPYYYGGYGFGGYPYYGWGPSVGIGFGFGGYRGGGWGHRR
jgi:hypothetical protein